MPERPDPPEEGLGHLGLKLTYPIEPDHFRLVDLADGEDDG